MKLSNLNIRTKLIGTCLLLGLVPVAVVGAVAWNVNRVMADSKSQEYRAVALSIADKIDRNLFERYGDVQAFGLNGVVQNRDDWYQATEDNPIVQAMNSYVDTYDIYYLTLLVDLEGKVIAVNSKDQDGRAINSSQLYETSFANCEWLVDCKSKRFYESEDGSFTGTVVEHLYVDPNVRDIYGDEGLAIAFSAPVYDKDGQAIAVWKNVAKFSLVEEIIWAAYAELKERNLGSAELTLLDKEGNVIIDCDPTTRGTEEVVRDLSVIGKLNLAEKGVQAAQAVVAGETGVLTNSYHARKKINQVAGFAPLDGALGFPGMEWNVLVRVAATEVFADVYRLKSRLLVLGLMTFLTVPLVSVFLAKRLIGPIHQTLHVLSEMTNGDLTQHLDCNTNDEFGELAVGFNAFVQRLRQTISAIFQDTRTLQQASEKMMANATTLSTGAASSQEKATSVAAASEQLSVSMETMSDSTEKMSTMMTSTASAVEEMQATISEIARSAERSTAVADEATKLVERSNDKVGDLGAAANEIGKVIEVIQDIAEQTNLLALNATIEAARAGDAGKGFAVVATEVKELAKQTAAATDDIRARIEAIQSTTSEAVQSIETIGKGISDVNEVTRTIASAVDEQAITTKNISDNVTQAARAAETNAIGIKESATASMEISRNIAGLSTTAKETNVTAAKTRIGSDELISIVERLNELVKVFNVGDGGTEHSEANLLPSVPPEIRASWERVAATSFLDTFYNEFASDPRIAGYFAKTDMTHQKVLLRNSLIHVINYPAGDAAAKRTITVLSQSHNESGLNVLPDLYKHWEKALLTTLQRHDPQWNSNLATKWKVQIKPAVDEMRNSYASVSTSRASRSSSGTTSNPAVVA
ncbi:MAG: HAMP domain-containing protein [Planctomycetales bacterium]|nr:HAMP domain-containing protein [Planctomycetales bacterium]